jgi:hypothetical protein
VATDVLVQYFEFRSKCQDVVLDRLLHFRVRWEFLVASDYCLRRMIWVVHR